MLLSSQIQSVQFGLTANISKNRCQRNSTKDYRKYKMEKLQYLRVSPTLPLMAYWALTLALLTAEASMALLDLAGGVWPLPAPAICRGEPLLYETALMGEKEEKILSTVSCQKLVNH